MFANPEWGSLGNFKSAFKVCLFHYNGICLKNLSGGLAAVCVRSSSFRLVECTLWLPVWCRFRLRYDWRNFFFLKLNKESGWCSIEKSVFVYTNTHSSDEV